MKPEVITIISNALVVIIVAIAEIIKTKNNKKEKDSKDISKLIENNTEVELSIISHLDVLKEYTNADRILIFEFHNGEYLSGGRSAIKMSCTFEVVRAGISRSINELKNIELNQYPVSIGAVLREGQIDCSRTSDIIEAMPCLYRKMDSTDVKGFYVKLIRNVEGYPMGLIMVEYCKNKYQNPDNEHLDETIGVIKEKLNSLKKK